MIAPRIAVSCMIKHLKILSIANWFQLKMTGYDLGNFCRLCCFTIHPYNFRQTHENSSNPITLNIYDRSKICIEIQINPCENIHVVKAKKTFFGTLEYS